MVEAALLANMSSTW